MKTSASALSDRGLKREGNEDQDLIDGYDPILEVVGDHLESLESNVIDNPSPAVLGELNRLKNQMINLRRAIWPQREAINELVRGDHSLISEEVGVYLRDTYDHCIQTSEVAEMYREMVTGLMNTYSYAILWGAMFAVVVGMLVFFYRKGWIGSGR